MWLGEKRQEFLSCVWLQLLFILSSVLFIDGACHSSVWPVRRSFFICGSTVIVIAWLTNSTIRTLLIVSPHFDSSNDTRFSASFCSLLNHSLHLSLSFLLFFHISEKESVNKGVKVLQICSLSWPRFLLSCYFMGSNTSTSFIIFTRNLFITSQVCCFTNLCTGRLSN